MSAPKNLFYEETCECSYLRATIIREKNLYEVSTFYADDYPHESHEVFTDIEDRAEAMEIAEGFLKHRPCAGYPA